MKLQKNLLLTGMFIIFSATAMNCGSDPAIEGDKAFQNENYNIAIKHYLQAVKDKPEEKQVFEEQIALSYMLRGQKLYSRSKNVKAFSGNFEKGAGYIPVEPSKKFNQEYSKVLFDLAVAYLSSRPENEIQKEEYLNKAIGYLEDANVYDNTNSSADSLFSKNAEQG
jgi:hypothetical protein